MKKFIEKLFKAIKVLTPVVLLFGPALKKASPILAMLVMAIEFIDKVGI